MNITTKFQVYPFIAPKGEKVNKVHTMCFQPQTEVSMEATVIKMVYLKHRTTEILGNPIKSIVIIPVDSDSVFTLDTNSPMMEEDVLCYPVIYPDDEDTIRGIMPEEDGFYAMSLVKIDREYYVFTNIGDSSWSRTDILKGYYQFTVGNYAETSVSWAMYYV